MGLFALWTPDSTPISTVEVGVFVVETRFVAVPTINMATTHVTV